jgi:hypothetical protein
MRDAALNPSGLASERVQPDRTHSRQKQSANGVGPKSQGHRFQAALKMLFPGKENYGKANQANS